MKDKRADIRISTPEANFIKKHKLSKTELFKLGLRIAEMCEEKNSPSITVVVENGDKRVFVVFESGVIGAEENRLF